MNSSTVQSLSLKMQIQFQGNLKQNQGSGGLFIIVFYNYGEKKDC